MFRKPLSTLAAFTDRDLGMRMGFSRITVGKKKKRGREKRTIVSREEDDSQPNLAVGDRVCCVGVKLRSYTGHCSVLSLTFDGPRTALRLPQLNDVTIMRRKTFREIVFPSKPKSKDIALLHRLVPVLRQVFFSF